MPEKKHSPSMRTTCAVCCLDGGVEASTFQLAKVTKSRPNLERETGIDRTRNQRLGKPLLYH